MKKCVYALCKVSSVAPKTQCVKQQREEGDRKRDSLIVDASKKKKKKKREEKVSDVTSKVIEIITKCVPVRRKPDVTKFPWNRRNDDAANHSFATLPN